MTPRIASVLLLAAGLLGGSAAIAQPSPAPSPSPSPAGISLPNTNDLTQIINEAVEVFKETLQQGILNRQNDFTGTVTYFRRFDMQVQVGNSNYRTVHLHQGTIINPTGKTLANGMRVRVRGQSQPDGSLDADEIDVVS